MGGWQTPEFESPASTHGEAVQGEAWLGGARQGRATGRHQGSSPWRPRRTAPRGWAWHRQCWVRQGSDGRGMARPGLAGNFGSAWLGAVRLGRAGIFRRRDVYQ